MRRHVADLLRRTGLFGLAFELRGLARRLDPRVLARNAWCHLAGRSDGLPLPTERARYLVAGSTDIGWFFEGGELAARSIREALEVAGRPIESLGRVLDFGCGCGRVLRQWSSVHGVEFFGTDLQAELVAECTRTVPFAKAATTGPEPPLPFEDSSFDLVYCLSVFTHLDERQQLMWRDEIARVLRPGGMWLLTVQGRSYVPKLSDSERARFQSGDIVCQGRQYRGRNVCQAFHPPEYVSDVLAAELELICLLPEGARGNPKQDLVLLRRPVQGEARAEPAAQTSEPAVSTV